MSFELLDQCFCWFNVTINLAFNQAKDVSFSFSFCFTLSVELHIRYLLLPKLCFDYLVVLGTSSRGERTTRQRWSSWSSWNSWSTKCRISSNIRNWCAPKSCSEFYRLFMLLNSFSMVECYCKKSHCINR